ncbi:MAG: FG-GAP repeat protein, partial [Verrucomicrobiota bacterium]
MRTFFRQLRTVPFPRVFSLYLGLAAYGFLALSSALTSRAALLEASDGTVNDLFGDSVSQSGSSGLVGAGSQYGVKQGWAYLFRNLDTANGTVTQSAKLVASDGALGDYFGNSVSQSGNSGLVGAYYGDITYTNQGAAYLFRNLDTATGTVNQTAKLIASDGASNDALGYSVSLSGSIGLVSAHGAVIGANRQGAAYIFRNLDTVTGTVTQAAKLIASDGAANDAFSVSVSLSGNSGLAGAYAKNSSQGAAYLYRNLDTATGTVTQNAKLTASDGAANDYLGFSVSQSGSNGLVGAYGKNSSQGAAYLFRNLDTATGTVTQTAKLTASDGATGDFFGFSVSQSGNNGLAGAYGKNSSQGAAYLFRNLDTASGTVAETVKITASAGAANDQFGFSVGLDGDQFIIGAQKGNGMTVDSGTAYS